MRKNYVLEVHGDNNCLPKLQGNKKCEQDWWTKELRKWSWMMKRKMKKSRNEEVGHECVLGGYGDIAHSLLQNGLSMNWGFRRSRYECCCQCAKWQKEVVVDIVDSSQRKTALILFNEKLVFSHTTLFLSFQIAQIK